MCAHDKPHLTRQVLTYLSEHSGAQDTLEGIVEWWLLEQRIRQQAAEVSEVLDELTSRRLVLERRAGDSRIHYRINPVKMKEVRQLLKSGDVE